MKKSQLSQAKMKDEEFKKNHKLEYIYLVISFYFQYILMPSMTYLYNLFPSLHFIWDYYVFDYTHTLELLRLWKTQ